jgi:hypothetical protein
MVIGLAMRTLTRARAVTFFCIVERRGVGYTELYAIDGFSPLSDICDSVVAS